MVGIEVTDVTPDMHTPDGMYHIPKDQYQRIIARVVKDLGEPKRTFREVFRRAHGHFMQHENPSVHSLNLKEVYSDRSLPVILSIMRKSNLIDQDGFFTVAFHTAYYSEYQRLCKVSGIITDL